VGLSDHLRKRSEVGIPIKIIDEAIAEFVLAGSDRSTLYLEPIWMRRLGGWSPLSAHRWRPCDGSDVISKRAI
jgi:hypothetical protein